MKPKSPCSRDCPDRDIGCHSRCVNYLEYEKQRFEYYGKIERAGTFPNRNLGVVKRHTSNVLKNRSHKK